MRHILVDVKRSLTGTYDTNNNTMQLSTQTFYIDIENSQNCPNVLADTECNSVPFGLKMTAVYVAVAIRITKIKHLLCKGLCFRI